MEAAVAMAPRPGASVLGALRRCVLVVLLAWCAGAPAAEQKTERVDDATITASVKAALQKDPNFSGWRIDVRTVKGTVYLSGIVLSETDKERARSITLGVPGVQAVSHDQLFVRTGRR